MSSFLWLTLYLLPLLGLTAVVFAWFGWRWRGADLQKCAAGAEAAHENPAPDAPTATERDATSSCVPSSGVDEATPLRHALSVAEGELQMQQQAADRARADARALETEVRRLAGDLDALRAERDLDKIALETTNAELTALRAEPTTAAHTTTPAQDTSPPAVSEKPKRKRPAKAKPAKTPAPAPTLRDKLLDLERQRGEIQIVLDPLSQEHGDWQRKVATLELKTPADPAGLALARRSLAESARRLNEARDMGEKLESQIRVLRRIDSSPALPAMVPDDDLTQIKGIKKAINEQLHAHGIRTWRQIALWDAEELRVFSELLAFKNRASREKWQEPARALHEAAHGPLP